MIGHPASHDPHMAGHPASHDPHMTGHPGSHDPHMHRGAQYGGYPQSSKGSRTDPPTKANIVLAHEAAAKGDIVQLVSVPTSPTAFISLARTQFLLLAALLCYKQQKLGRNLGNAARLS